MACLRFLVQDEDMFGDPNFLGQAVVSVVSLRKGKRWILKVGDMAELWAYCRTGYRSLPLRNGYSEELELSSLLVHADIRNARVGSLPSQVRSTPVIFCTHVGRRRRLVLQHSGVAHRSRRTLFGNGHRNEDEQESFGAQGRSGRAED